MKLLYCCDSQTKDGFLKSCYFKSLRGKRDLNVKGSHHHSEFEIHIIIKGHQSYGFGDNTETVKAGSYLMIAPNVSHFLASSSDDCEKFALVFSLNSEIGEIPPYFIGASDKRILENISFIRSECARRDCFSEILICKAVEESAALFLRAVGLNCLASDKCKAKRADNRSELAKRFISDNADKQLSLPEVAAYCHVSPRQLMRIFKAAEGMSVSEYITKCRLELIKKLLGEHTLTLAEIGERTGFANEYYFNSYFKKNCGVPPGEYRNSRN